MAERRPADRLALEFYRFPFEPYAPVCRQMLRLLRKVNAVRKRAGHDELPYQVLPLRRRVVKPFEVAERSKTSRDPTGRFTAMAGNK
jgi:hypothetical protein